MYIEYITKNLDGKITMFPETQSSKNLLEDIHNKIDILVSEFKKETGFEIYLSSVSTYEYGDFRNTSLRFLVSHC